MLEEVTQRRERGAVEASHGRTRADRRRATSEGYVAKT